MKAFEIKPDWLLYLRAVAEARSIRLAAERLYVTEKILRYNLKALEDLLQATLFTSGEQGLELTSQGRALLQHSQGFIQKLDQVQQRLEALSHADTVFRLAVPHVYPTHFLAPILSAMYARFEGLQLTIQVDSQREVEKLVASGLTDIGLVIKAPASTQILRLKGPSWPGVYVERAQGSVEARYLLPRLWRYGDSQPVEYPAEVKAFPVRYIGRISLIESLCLQGVGIGYLPLPFVLPLIEQGRLVQSKGPRVDFRMDECLLLRDWQSLSEPARFFIECLQQHWQRVGTGLDDSDD